MHGISLTYPAIAPIRSITGRGRLKLLCQQGKNHTICPEQNHMLPQRITMAGCQQNDAEYSQERYYNSTTTYLTQGISIRTHVSQDDQYVLLTLVGQELGSSKGQAGSDDTLNSKQTTRREEEKDTALCKHIHFKDPCRNYQCSSRTKGKKTKMTRGDMLLTGLCHI